MEDFTIKLNVSSEGKIKVEHSAPLTLEILAQTHLTALLSAMKQLPREAKPDVYDMMNVAFSNVLTQYAPEIELRPSLTEEAILKAENDILEERWNSEAVSKVQVSNEACSSDKQGTE